MSKSEEVKTPELRSFAQVLQAMEGGSLHDDISHELNDLLAQLQDFRASNGGKPKGSLTIKLDFQVDGEMIHAGATIAVKAPKISRRNNVFFLTPQNNLTQHNPRQASLDLRAVDMSAGEIKSA